MADCLPFSFSEVENLTELEIDRPDAESMEVRGLDEVEDLLPVES